MTSKIAAIKKRSLKAWVHLISVEAVLDFIFGHEHSYIVDEAYLVVFDICQPWYSNGEIILSEMLVGKYGQGSSFDVVPRFLEDMAREAGCSIVSAGTALAISDDALASLYSKAGLTRECSILTKRI